MTTLTPRQRAAIDRLHRPDPHQIDPLAIAALETVARFRRFGKRAWTVTSESGGYARPAPLDRTTLGSTEIDADGNPVTYRSPVERAALNGTNLTAHHDRLAGAVALLDFAHRELASVFEAIGCIDDPASPPDKPDDMWCANCLRAHVFSPIATRPTGKRIYSDRCRPCGEFRAAEKFDRPTWMIDKARSGRILETDVARARRQHKATQPSKKKGKRR